MQINGVIFNAGGAYSLDKIVKTLKKAGRYHKCKLCGRKWVNDEGKLCESCAYLVSIEYSDKRKKSD